MDPRGLRDPLGWPDPSVSLDPLETLGPLARPAQTAMMDPSVLMALLGLKVTLVPKVRLARWT